MVKRLFPWKRSLTTPSFYLDFIFLEVKLISSLALVPYCSFKLAGEEVIV